MGRSIVDLWYNNREYMKEGFVMYKDTIAAISTATGEGAISIVRLSGEDAIAIANKLYKEKDLSKVKSHTINYGHIVEDGKIIDEVMVSVMRAPRTFTREDIVEINCHGGFSATNKILETLLKNGARISEPGEFTKRAFLNGRIDLVQAEATMDIIKAKNDNALNLAVNNLDGRVSSLVKGLRQKILNTIATIEVNIDYPEYDDVEEISHDILKPRLEEVQNEVAEILDRSRNGRIIREGIKTVIVGSPNVGKSSLLNALMQEDKAIVTEIAGTTRDVIEGNINVRGVSLNLIDTAGIRKTDDLVEGIGVEKSKKLLNEAELTLFVVNNNNDLNEDEIEILSNLDPLSSIIIINKVDLSQKLDRTSMKEFMIVETSIVNDHGLEDLEQAIIKMFALGELNNKDMTYVSNIRHIDLLNKVTVNIEDALMGIDSSMPLDLIEIDIKLAWANLGEIIGEDVKEDLLDQLFSQFCLGK